MKKLALFVLLVVCFGVALFIIGCSKKSVAEKEVACRLAFPFCENVSSSQIIEVKDKTYLYPFLLGMSYFNEGRYDQSKKSLGKLKKKYPDSKVLKFYIALSEYMAKNKAPVNDSMLNFFKASLSSESLKKEYGFEDGHLKDDKLYLDLIKEYKLDESCKNIEAIKNKIAGWFQDKKDKTPEDYLIASLLSDKYQAIISDGYKKYPNNAFLILSYLKSRSPKPSKENFEKIIEPIKGTSYGALISAVNLCRSDDDKKLIKAWGDVEAQPLCKEQENLLLNIISLPTVKTIDVSKELRDYYKRDVSSAVGYDLNEKFFLFNGVSLPQLDILSFSRRILVTTYLKAKKGDLKEAESYIMFNKWLLRVLNMFKPKTLLARQTELLIEIETLKAEVGLEKMKKYQNSKKIDRLDRLILEAEKAKDINSEIFKIFPAAYTIGFPPGNDFEIFLANRKLPVDNFFSSKIE